MKALVYLGPRRMELQDVPDPTPEPGDVRVRVRAAAICDDPDLCTGSARRAHGVCRPS